MLRTHGDPSQCSEEAERRVGFDSPPAKYPALPFLILGILKALVQDGFRCIVTGTYDYRLLAQSTELQQEVTDCGVATAFTKCVYIFPQSIAMISDIEYATSIWTIMTHLGFEDLPEKLVGDGIHTQLSSGKLKFC
jgi:hypothetical protein